jgi:protein-disulfide isomerase
MDNPVVFHDKETDGMETPLPETRRKPSFLLVAFLPLMFALGIGMGYLLWAPASPLAPKPTPVPTEVQVKNPAQAAVPTAAAVKRYDVPIGDDFIRGNTNAPITIIEFSDYECPYCKKWFLETWPQLLAYYGDKIRFVYRDFPLYGLHANAPMAAEAANCAGEQNAYYPFHDKLLSGSTLSQDLYVKYATDLKLNLTQFNDCLSSRKTKAEVDADYAWATNLGIQSTPTFFINGLALIGAQPFDVFKQVIDKELAGSIPK